MPNQSSFNRTEQTKEHICDYRTNRLSESCHKTCIFLHSNVVLYESSMLIIIRHCIKLFKVDFSTSLHEVNLHCHHFCFVLRCCLFFKMIKHCWDHTTAKSCQCS